MTIVVDLGQTNKHLGRKYCLNYILFKHEAFSMIRHTTGKQRGINADATTLSNRRWSNVDCTSCACCDATNFTDLMSMFIYLAKYNQATTKSAFHSNETSKDKLSIIYKWLSLIVIQVYAKDLFISTC